jgi:hypothetical protein
MELYIWPRTSRQVSMNFLSYKFEIGEKVAIKAMQKSKITDYEAF